jgi:type 1 glutamine amidotransferase
MRRVLLCAAIGAALAAGGCGDSGTSRGASPAIASAPSAPPQAAPARLLVVTHTTGFRHDSIPAAEEALRRIGAESGIFSTEFCRTADDVRARLTAAGLAGIDAVFFANTTGDLGIPDVHAFVDWVASGKGFLGAHSASDTYHESAAYLAMLGGEFVTHGSIVEADVRVSEPANPAVAHLAPSFRIADEWYRFQMIGSGRTILLKFDRNPPDGLGAAGEAADLPLAWQKSHGSGRVFYTALGHRAETWEDARFRKHLLEAIRWAIGR